MKKTLFKTAFIAFVSLAVFAGVFSSCKSDDESTKPANTATLTIVTDSCQVLLTAATTTDYPQAAITAFQTTLTAAKAAAANTAITQTAVDNLVVQLRTAKTTFLAAAYGAIPSTALLMGMSFDETVASNQFTTEGKAWTAVLKTGPSEIFGTNTAIPTFITGKVGKAMHFGLGSHLEVSNYAAADLLGKELSIAVWIKTDSTKAGNYIIAYNYWNSWKFNIEDHQKPFFTVKTLAPDGYVNADNEVPNSVPDAVWKHLVISMNLTTGYLSFYLNGVLSKEWTKDTQPNLTRSTLSYSKVLPLMVGVATTYTEALTWDWAWEKKPANWDYFIGSMDELKVYKIALTAGQVAKLYKEENK